MRALDKLLALTFVLAVSVTAEATWYGDPAPNGFDGMMLENEYPWWPRNTYYAHWNLNTWPKGGYFYSGVSVNKPDDVDEANVKPGLVWSFWGSKDYHGRFAKCIYMGSFVYGRQHLGEGASGACGGGSQDWIFPHRPYRWVIRLWDTDVSNDTCKVGQWAKDTKTGCWRHWGTFLVPTAATGFHGNGGFLENCGAPLHTGRELLRGPAYYRLNGKWCPEPEIEINAPQRNAKRWATWMVKPIEGGRRLSMKFSENEHDVPTIEPGKKHMFKISQPESPSFDPIKVEGMRVAECGGQYLVRWEIPGTNVAPQIGYAIDGVREMTPERRHAVVARRPKTLTVYDIFGREKSFSLPSPKPAKVAVPTVKPDRAMVRGLHFRYGENDKRKYEGVSTGLDLTFRGQRDRDCDFAWNGYLRVPESGAYVFVLKACSGAVLKLGGKVFIDASGEHSMTPYEKGVFLNKGLVEFSLDYRIDRPKGPDDCRGVSVEWQRAGGKLVEIPARNYFCRGDGGTHGAMKPVETVRTVNGRIADKDILFPGENAILERRFYADGWVADSKPVRKTGPENRLGPWTESFRGETGLAHSLTATADRMAFAGESDLMLHGEKIEGDFRVTCRVPKMGLCRRDGVPKDCWAGLRATSRLESDHPSELFAVFRTSSEGVRCGSDTKDLGGSGKSSYGFGDEFEWLRLTRAGDFIVAEISKDGKEWKVAQCRSMTPLKGPIWVGPIFHAKSGGIGKVFSAEITGYRMERGTFAVSDADRGPMPSWWDAYAHGREEIKGLNLSKFPGRKNLVTSAQANPLDEKMYLVVTHDRATDVTEIWCSENAGEKWRLANRVKGILIGRALFDCRHTDQLWFVTDRGFWKSNFRGDGMIRIVSGLDQLTGFHPALGRWLCVDTHGFLATEKEVYMTTSFGMRWSRRSGAPDWGTPREVRILEPHHQVKEPSAEVVTDRGVWRSDDNGRTWKKKE